MYVTASKAQIQKNEVHFLEAAVLDEPAKEREVTPVIPRGLLALDGKRPMNRGHKF